jgi:hypothetical protein
MELLPDVWVVSMNGGGCISRSAGRYGSAIQGFFAEIAIIFEVWSAQLPMRW